MTTTSRPETVEQYVLWANANLSIDFASVATRNRYETNVQNAQNAIQDSRFMREFEGFIAMQEEQHQKVPGGGLLMGADLAVVRKPFQAAVTKSYRINVLRNRRFPSPPADGWVSPDNWYMRFDDLVRGTLICKFLDGPKILAPALDSYASSMGLVGRHVPRNTDDGYYAFHHYTSFPVDLVDAAWQTQAATVEFEIQLTTQLQEVLRELTHPLYEEARLASGRPDDSWKWDFETPRFRTSYLGHTLHMIEAVIVQVRDTTKRASEIAPTAETKRVPKEQTGNSSGGGTQE
jgi:hypothetical protein